MPIPLSFFTLRNLKLSAVVPSRLRAAALPTDRSDRPEGLPVTSDRGPERKFWQIALADLERQIGGRRERNSTDTASAPTRLPPAGSAMAPTPWRSGAVCLCRLNS